MYGLSEHRILEKKARQLCRRDGKAWSLDDFENGVSGVTMLTVVADEKKRGEYLSRAKAILELNSMRRLPPLFAAPRGGKPRSQRSKARQAF
jgi:hypothetical protein